MLGKLIKYDLKWILKLILIYCFLGIFFAVTGRLFGLIENSMFFDIISKVCNGISIAMLINAVVNAVIRGWVRVIYNLYKDESYLTHTLPIEKETLYLSKIISSIITTFTSIIVIALTIFIAYYSKENLETVKNMLFPLADAYNSTVMLILIVFFFILFLEFMNIIQCGFTGIILGHKRNNNKTLFSVLFGFVTFTVSQLIVLITLFIVALFNKDIMNLIFTNEMISIDSTKIIIYMSIIMYTVVLIASSFINVKLFEKGVNVD